jgi:gamma-glutamylputrescine oxidase
MSNVQVVAHRTSHIVLHLTSYIKMNHPNTLSFWEREQFFKNIDVAIIGSGIVGLNAALTLKEQQPKSRIAVFERGALPEGASTRNAGFACFGSITELLDDLETQTEDAVFSLVEKRYRGLKRLRQRVGDTKLDYKDWGGYEIFKKTTPENALAENQVFQQCQDKLSYFNKNLKNIVGHDEVYKIVQNTFGFKNTLPTLIHNTAEGQIDTGKMMTALLNQCKQKKITIFNGLKIKALNDQNTEGVVLITEEGWEIEASKAIIATNGFARRLLPDLEVTPARNQVLVTKPLKNLPIKGCFHYDKGYYYFRNIGNRLLLGGGRNLDFQGEMTDDFENTELIQNNLLNLLKTVILPNTPFEIDTWWSGILGIGAIKEPIIKHISPNIVVAVRMGGMGVAIGSLIGEEASIKILETKQ